MENRSPEIADVSRLLCGNLLYEKIYIVSGLIPPCSDDLYAASTQAIV
jgi:hypothetical protein